MSQLFLASNFYIVASRVAELLNHAPQGQTALYITTAAEPEGGSKSWLDADREALKNLGLISEDYTITGKGPADFIKDFKNVRYILFSGGNVFYLLAQAQQTGFVSFIREYIQRNDTVYLGSSAGAAVAGANIYPLLVLDDPEKAPHIRGYEGFGGVDVCLLPHWGSQNFKQKYLIKGLEHIYNDEYKIILLTDKQFLSIAADGSYEICEVE